MKSDHYNLLRKSEFERKKFSTQQMSKKCNDCKKEIAYFKEWKCATCNVFFDENCYIDKCSYYGCAEEGKRQCSNCILSGKERKYCMDEDCNCENINRQKFKRQYRSEELKKAYENAFGI